MRWERGSATVETVILSPVLAAMVLFAVYGGRSTQAVSQLRHAADQGARAASMVRPSRMADVGRQTVLDDLRSNGDPCRKVMVNVAVDEESSTRTVLVQVECTISKTGLGLLSLNDRIVQAESIEVVDVWRVDE